MNSRLILVGGFLGAGKTTLLAEAVKVLAVQGRRVGLITNDQAPELVDTAFLSQGSENVAEVSGSCFCCNFPGLLAAMAKLRSDAEAEILLAEPVGSCTDLSATIVQPLRDLHRGELTVAPLSVLVDPARLTDILRGGVGGLHPSAAYIYRKQMEEADILLITKIDLLSEEEKKDLTCRAALSYPLATIHLVSAQSGEGVEAWLSSVLESSDAGKQIAGVDYDIYAEGEAVLGWLNSTFRLTGSKTDWDALSGVFLRRLGERIDAIGASVGHVKIMIEAGGDFSVSNLTGNVNTLRIRGSGVVGSHARMTLNARVEMSPETLENIVREELAALGESGIDVTVLAWRCLSPGRPEPTFRYDHLVSIS